MASEFNTPSASLVPLIYGDNPETWTTAILLPYLMCVCYSNSDLNRCTESLTCCVFSK